MALILSHGEGEGEAPLTSPFAHGHILFTLTTKKAAKPEMKTFNPLFTYIRLMYPFNILSSELQTLHIQQILCK